MLRGVIQAVPGGVLFADHVLEPLGALLLVSMPMTLVTTRHLVEGKMALGQDGKKTRGEKGENASIERQDSAEVRGLGIVVKIRRGRRAKRKGWADGGGR